MSKFHLSGKHLHFARASLNEKWRVLVESMLNDLTITIFLLSSERRQPSSFAAKSHRNGVSFFHLFTVGSPWARGGAPRRRTKLFCICYIVTSRASGSREAHTVLGSMVKLQVMIMSIYLTFCVFFLKFGAGSA